MAPAVTVTSTQEVAVPTVYPRVVEPTVGVPGSVYGVADAVAAVLLPAAFVATTPIVYEVPFESPVIVQVVLVVVQDALPGDAVAV